MIEALPAYGWDVMALELHGSFPAPAAAALQQASDVLDRLPDDTITIVDSLALGAMPDALERHASRLRIVALMHLPLLSEAEGRALRAASLVIATGTAALPLLAPYRLPGERIVVVEPGTDSAPLARGSAGDAVQMLSVATLNAGKGHAALLHALALVPFRDWRLACAGSLTRDPETAARVAQIVERRGLQDKVTLAGDLAAAGLEEHYDRADVFVLATRQETYGMAVAEAIAHGLPVVASATGAIPELVGDTAGIVVPGDDLGALADALTRVLGDAGLRARLAEGARRKRETLPTWGQAAARMAAALDTVALHG
jgi:glycosyltransferase involved in cell wall biosynthesis